MLSFDSWKKSVMKNYPIHGFLLNVNIYSQTAGKIFSPGCLMSYIAVNGNLKYLTVSDVWILQFSSFQG